MPDGADQPGQEGAPGSDDTRGEQAAETLLWVALLTDRKEPPDDACTAELFVATWWSESFEANCEALLAKLHALPEPLLTNRFAQDVKRCERTFDLIRPIFLNLVKKQESFSWAITQLRRLFHGDETQVVGWKHDMENLAALVYWTPAFLQAHEYLGRALPLGQAALDEERHSLLGLIESPHKFAAAQERDVLDRRFIAYKRNYVDAYSSAHDYALHLIDAGASKSESKVDALALHNLEILSTLAHAEKGYLNRVRMIAHWIRHNHCELPVRLILDRHPRCYCNFNPGRRLQPGDSAAQVNAAIAEGIEYFRKILSACKTQIIHELKLLKVDDPTARQIASLLSRGPLAALKPRAIEVLNRVIEKYRPDFLSAMRSTARKSSSEVGVQ
jgi:hypothetical protein